MSRELDPLELAAADLLVAVDAGADALERVGLEPGLLVGDMDSVTAGNREYLEDKGVEIVTLPEAKDETDLEAALRLVVGRGADEVVIYGALGGPRLDHLVGNILLLMAPWLRGTDVRLVDDSHEVFLAHGDASVQGEPGDQVSLSALTAEVEDVRTEGLLYPLLGETLVRHSTRSISNELTAAQARVKHGTGTLLVIHYREGQR